MLKCGGDIVTKWMVNICQVAWEGEGVPADWTKAIIIPVYKGRREAGEGSVGAIEV